jgi:hypothetical protein
MTKYRGIIVASLALTLASLSPAAALGNAGGTDRPVKGTAVGDITVSITPGLPVEVDVTGVATHLGKFTGHFEGSAEIIGGTVFGEGTLTLVAANGDELTGTFTFTGPPPSPEPHEVATEFTITGGTGRFADASGTITTPLVATPSCFDEPSCPGALVETVEGPLTGQISY